jgi:hypothetical protein
MRKLFIGVCLTGLFLGISKISFAGDEEIIAALNKTSLVLQIKTQITELKKQFLQNITVNDMQTIENFKKEIMNQDNNKDFKIYSKYLKNSNEYIEGCKEISKKIFKLTIEGEEYNKLSKIGRFNFVKSLYTVDPYYCAIGFAAGVGGCSEFAYRLAFISGDETLADVFMASCMALVTLDYLSCMAQ